MSVMVSIERKLTDDGDEALYSVVELPRRPGIIARITRTTWSIIFSGMTAIVDTLTGVTDDTTNALTIIQNPRHNYLRRAPQASGRGSWSHLY